MKNSQKNLLLSCLIILVIALAASNIWTFMNAHDTKIDKDTQGVQLSESNSDPQALPQGTIWTLPLPPGTSGPGQFYDPTDIALDMNGHVYIADSGNNRIQVFDSNGNFIIQLRSFYGLRAITIVNSSMFTVESNVIKKYTLNGTLLTSWTLNTPPQGTTPLPVDIAADSNYVYVLDSANYCVQKFTANGTFVKQFGSQGEGPGQFVESPLGIAVDISGNVYVTAIISSESSGPFGTIPDGGVVKFTANGDYLTELGVMDLYYPREISVDSKGNVYVADTGSHANCVQVFAPNGNNRFSNAGPPGSVAIDSNGYIYSVDSVHNSIFKLSPIY